MQKHWFFMVLLLFIGSKQALLSQSDCGTDGYMEQLLQRSTEFQLEQQSNERYTTLYQKNQGLRSSTDPDTVLTIKVVVHILHNIPEENFTDLQIIEQLESTNRDFRGHTLNASSRWPQASDPKIQFVLADKDPEGNATTGIIRKYTSRRYFNKDNSMKSSQSGGTDAWPSDQFLNIWVCDLNKTLGYAQLPGGPPETDGVVVNYRNFGINSLDYGYNLGRTLTHEIGHWLNLYHTYYGGCSGGDFVEDTPSMAYASYGCQMNKATCGSLDMVENFMDASYDYCVSIFTEGQKVRMRAQLAPGGARHSLLGIPDSVTIEEPPVDVVACAAPRDVQQSNVGTIFEISWDPMDAKQYLFEFKLSHSSRWMKFATTRPYLKIQGINENWSYSVRITNICEDGQKSAPVEIKHNTSNRKAISNDQIHSISVYDFAGRHYQELHLVEDYEATLFNLKYELNNGLYLLVKRDKKGRHLGTEKWAVLR
ncbi:MAG: hypothetical protein Sapg2KO_09120 [Saprospiraceae bacterium]